VSGPTTVGELVTLLIKTQNRLKARNDAGLIEVYPNPFPGGDHSGDCGTACCLNYEADLLRRVGNEQLQRVEAALRHWATRPQSDPPYCSRCGREILSPEVLEAAPYKLLCPRCRGAGPTMVKELISLLEEILDDPEWRPDLTAQERVACRAALDFWRRYSDQVGSRSPVLCSQCRRKKLAPAVLWRAPYRMTCSACHKLNLKKGRKE